MLQITNSQQLPSRVKSFIDSLSEYSWFSPGEEVDLQLVTKLVQEHQARLKAFGQKQSYNIQFIHDWKLANIIAKDVAAAVPTQANWNATRLQVMKNARVYIDDVAFTQSLTVVEKMVQLSTTKAVSEAIWFHLQEIALEMVQEDLKGIMLDVSWAVAYDIARNAVWFIVEEEMMARGYKNPFAPLLEIYKMGLWPMGLVLEKKNLMKKRFFAVFIPDKTIL